MTWFPEESLMQMQSAVESFRHPMGKDDTNGSFLPKNSV